MGKRIHKLARFVGNLKQEYRHGLEDGEEKGEEEANNDRDEK